MPKSVELKLEAGVRQSVPCLAPVRAGEGDLRADADVARLPQVAGSSELP
jgi:hypothetical protein